MTPDETKKATTAPPNEGAPASGSGSDGGSPIPQIGLPKGGGAIRGIGETFTTNPVTGTGTMSIPVPASPGRSGFDPKLTLSYDSGAGNGPFGLGWSLSSPSITRKTDKGLPLYDDAGESDTYVLSGAEDLVPVLSAGKPVVIERGGYRVKQYRPRTEGLFARIERWTDLATGVIHWRSISRDNITTWYGDTDQSRIADPDNPRHIFSWLIRASCDAKGNAIRYTYEPENSDRVELSAANEQNRSAAVRGTNRYLKRIEYGSPTPVLDTAGVDGVDGWMFEAVFDYGDHADVDPTPTASVLWPVRSDPFSSHRSGFEVRTYRLCRRVLMFHRFAELTPNPCLVKSLDLTYDENPFASYLTAATQTGYVRDGDSYRSASMPAAEFDYSEAVIDSTVCEIDTDSLEGLPRGLGEGYRWTDLDGEGASGILVEQGGGWFYKRNRSANNTATEDGKTTANARFGPLEAVDPRPSVSLGAGARVTDLEGDGRQDVVLLSGPVCGFFERSDDGWEPFRAFSSWPNVPMDDPNQRLVDLTGDGKADILIAEDDVFVWYPSEGEAGFGPSNRVAKTLDEERGSRVVFADGTESIYLADMSGDGLSDLVRVRNGGICYWPNLGYGRFGSKVAMDRSPRMDHPDRFSQNRVRLTDVDGTGPVDLLYLGAGGVDVYRNESGNAWSPRQRLVAFPRIENVSSVDALDLLGTGTACLVWSSPLPDARRRTMRYVDLMGGTKPHLLIRSKNNLGAETHVTYAPSTRFYQDDRDAGRPWATRLPFPVHVVERHETIDAVSGNRFVSRYAYHHGYFDGCEREFRGFGYVEQWDTEEMATLREGGASPLATNYAGESNVPPVLTRTWFHTGAFAERGRISRQYEDDYFEDDGAAALLLPDTVLPGGLSADEAREACRALKGSILRREVYADDESPDAGTPYTITEQNYTIECLQNKGENRHAVFFVHPREAFDFNYERNTADPRIKHALTLDVDAYGNVLSSVSIGYGRTTADDELDPEYREIQARTLLVLSENAYTNAVDDADAYRTPAPCESATYEVTGAVPGTAGGRFTFDEALKIAAGELGSLRLLKIARTLYRADDLSAALAFGALQSRALPFEAYTKALTSGMQTDATYFDGHVSDAMLEDAGYVHFGGDSDWWMPSGRVYYSPGSDLPDDDPPGIDPPSVERSEAEAHFFLPRRFVDPFGNAAKVDYDAYDLIAFETTDAAGNTVTTQIVDETDAVIGGIDYRVLAADGITDPNGNRAAVVFDELGLVTATAQMGKPGAGEGDTSDDPTTTFTYELLRFANEGKPVRVTGRARETHGDSLTRWQTSYSYSDGFGREIQKKIQAEPGPVVEGGADVDPRWIGTGRTVFNNKGKPVKQYEPFFSATYEYEDEAAVVESGVTPILLYDPLDRVVGTLHPDHSYEKTVFDPWSQFVYDACDTTSEDDAASDPDIGGFVDRLPASAYSDSWYTLNHDPADPARYDAADKALEHFDTPTCAYFDSLGRPFLTVTDNNAENKYETLRTLDVEGNETALRDARRITVRTQKFDMTGRVVATTSPDAGDRQALADVAGKPVYVRDGMDRVVRTEYDVLRRPVATYVKCGADLETLAVKTVYGDDDVPTAAASNLRGRVYQVMDGAGLAVSETYDFKGNLTLATRQLAVDYTSDPDWSQSVALEEDGSGDPVVYVTETAYDALNRPTSTITPDDSESVPTYNDAGLLMAVDACLRGAAGETAFVSDIQYNARGQRTRIAYGNGAVTTYEYDPDTFRLTRLKTTRPDGSGGFDTLQDLAYAYDPVGNITRVTDAAQDDVYFQNTVVSVGGGYTYDALYRLTIATGREHPGQVPADTDYPYGDLPQDTDLLALVGYTETYAYDPVGNLTEMAHVGGWSRTYLYEGTSNRLTQAQTSAGTEGFFYDALGNMTSMGHLSAMTWDYVGRLRSTVKNGETVYYVYDASGSRVRKVAVNTQGGGSAIKHERAFLGGWEFYREYANGGTSTWIERETLHVADGEKRIALVETRTTSDGAVVTDPTPHQRYQLGNHLDTATVELDESAQVISYEEFYPFGTTSFHSDKNGSVAETSRKRYRYTGKERDDETGLYYFGARYYAPWLGRWTACDPAGFVDGTNRYAYTRNAPLKYRDPTGKACVPGQSDECAEPEEVPPGEAFVLYEPPEVPEYFSDMSWNFTPDQGGESQQLDVFARRQGVDDATDLSLLRDPSGIGDSQEASGSRHGTDRSDPAIQTNEATEPSGETSTLSTGSPRDASKPIAYSVAVDITYFTVGRTTDMYDNIYWTVGIGAGVPKAAANVSRIYSSPDAARDEWSIVSSLEGFAITGSLTGWVRGISLTVNEKPQAFFGEILGTPNASVSATFTIMTSDSDDSLFPGSYMLGRARMWVNNASRSIVNMYLDKAGMRF